MIFRGIRYPYVLDLTSFPHNLFETAKSQQKFYKTNVFTTYSHVTCLAHPSVSVIIDKYFNMVKAETPELMEKAWCLRHQAYGLETTFKMSEGFSKTLVMDQYDRRSVYFLIQHKETGVYAATTRLILHDNENPEQLFPVEQYCNTNELTYLNPYRAPSLQRFPASVYPKNSSVGPVNIHTLFLAYLTKAYLLPGLIMITGTVFSTSRYH